jgi:hypothetical protein
MITGLATERDRYAELTFFADTRARRETVD